MGSTAVKRRPKAEITQSGRNHFLSSSNWLLKLESLQIFLLKQQYDQVTAPIPAIFMLYSIEEWHGRE